MKLIFSGNIWKNQSLKNGRGFFPAFSKFLPTKNPQEFIRFYEG